jgi:hypothetical protein
VRADAAAATGSGLRVCLGVAGRVEDGFARLTNLPWTVDARAFESAIRIRWRWSAISTLLRWGAERLDARISSRSAAVRQRREDRSR